MLHTMTLPDFVAELASSSPAPGGGSIAALGGALAAGLSSMVGELTVGREKYAAVQEEMTRVKDEAKTLAAELLELIDRDTDAFNAFMAAMKLPKATDEEKVARREAQGNRGGHQRRTWDQGRLVRLHAVPSERDGKGDGRQHRGGLEVRDVDRGRHDAIGRDARGVGDAEGRDGHAREAAGGRIRRPDA